jgi:hypothetical protein
VPVPEVPSSSNAAASETKKFGPISLSVFSWHQKREEANAASQQAAEYSAAVERAASVVHKSVSQVGEARQPSLFLPPPVKV